MVKAFTESAASIMKPMEQQNSRGASLWRHVGFSAELAELCQCCFTSNWKRTRKQINYRQQTLKLHLFYLPHVKDLFYLILYHAV